MEQMANRQFPKSGKRRPAAYQMIADWVKMSWDKVSSDLIKKSFIECGIVKDLDVENLHFRLKELIKNATVLNNDSEKYGLTDTEDNDDDSEWLIFVILQQ